MKKSTIAIIAGLALAVGVVFLVLSKRKPSNTTPDGAIMGSVACVRNNDIKGLLTRVLTPEDYAKMKKEFDSKSKMSDKQKAEFNAMLTQLTAKNAEETIYGLIKPQLVEAQGQMNEAKKSFPGMIQELMSMQGGDKDADKKAAGEMAGALGTWIAGLKLDDEAKAKKGISIVCSTVRSLKINNADELEALTFDQVLVKSGKVMDGLKKVLDIYGMSINQTLDSVKVGKPEVKDSSAKVAVTYTFLGKTVTLSQTLTKSGDRWYGKVSK